jgi:hypothetical protein
VSTKVGRKIGHNVRALFGMANSCRRQSLRRVRKSPRRGDQADNRVDPPRLYESVEIRFRKLISRDAHLAANGDFHMLSNNALGVHDQRIGDELANVPKAAGGDRKSKLWWTIPHRVLAGRHVQGAGF